MNMEWRTYREVISKSAVAQTSSPYGLRSKAGGRTEAFTAENAEYAENGMKSLMLYLSDLCALCGKMLETRVRTWRQETEKFTQQAPR
jgi:hypothetical protein